MKRVSIITFIAIIVFTSGIKAGLDPSYSEKAVIDTVPFFANGTYDSSVPHPNDFTQHPIGQWPLRYYELVPYIKAVAESSKRVTIETNGETHEGRKLYNLFISSEKNIEELDELRTTMDKLADPRRSLSKAELDKMYAELPAFAWLGYSVHGDEISGTDAAMMLIYQLAAGTDAATMELLENVVIIVNPSQNPDGRERYLSMLQTYKSSVPNYNRRAMQHSGVWPWGRANHYLFDLNRDWILLTQPETKGKVATILKWHPQLSVDAHEMGSDATYLFSPPRQPVNYNTAGNIDKWGKRFAADQSVAFDQRGWTYYVGEWHEQWYPGYASAWPTFFGTIAVLYEMAGVDGQFVKQSDDYLLTYHEAVNKQFSSSLANLTTLSKNRPEILRDYRDARASIVAKGKGSKLSFVIEDDGDEIKTKRFIERLIDQGIEVQKATSEFTLSKATDIDGKKHSSKKFPAGTYVIRTDQPHGALAKAILEFDPHLKKKFLEEERREIEKHSGSRMYETSTWSVPLAYDMDAYMTNSAVKGSFENITTVELSKGSLLNPDAKVGFVINMVGEKTYLILARLFEKDFVVRASEKPFTIEGKSYNSGSLFIRRRGNSENMTSVLSELAVEIGIDVVGVNTGASSKGSYLGAGTFRLLSKPKVAIVAGDGVSYTSFGSLWYAIDKEIAFPHSLIQLSRIRNSSLDQYNVIVLPGSWGPVKSYLGKGGESKLRGWVEDGGTLICMGSSAVWAADSSSKMSQTVIMRQVLDKLDTYNKAASREIAAENPTVDTMALWYPDKVPADEKKEEDKQDKAKVTKEHDEWLRKFSPAGVMMKANLDMEDWLSFGMKKSVPVMVYANHVILSKPPVKTSARFAESNSLRLSGLLWPEARGRWANSAYATHERKGSGQIVLFATAPNQRAYFYGTRKMFLNAVLYGPGMGTRFEGPYKEE